MKMAKTNYAKKILAAGFLLCSFLISASAQTTTLTLKNGKAAVRKYVQPRRLSDADFYSLKLRKGQTVEIEVDSKTIYLWEENPCGMGFDLFDPNGEQIFLGDEPAWTDDWYGEIEKTGNYKIKVSMGCLVGGVSDSDLRKKKPAFKYSLTVRTK